jgi:DNA repair protein RadC
VSVEYHPTGSSQQATAVFAGSTGRPVGPEFRARIEDVVLAAIGSLSPRSAPEPEPAIDPAVFVPQIPPSLHAGNRLGGFSDGQSFRMRGQFAPAPDTLISERDTTPANDLRTLTDTGLLARLLRYVVPTEGAETASRAAAERFGSFAAVLSAPELELRKLPGLGTHTVAAIKLLHAAALRLSRAAIMDQPVLDGSDALIGYLTAVLARESIEHFRILFLDADGRLRADEAQARGTVNHTPVYPREVVRRALELKAASIILVHNHPSGDPSPSRDDIEMTKLIQQAAEVLGLTVRDHIIVGNGRWLSFRQQGLL